MLQYNCILPKLQGSIESLYSNRGGKVEFIYQVNDKESILLSKFDINHLNITRKNLFSIREYLEKILIVKAEEDYKLKDSSLFKQLFCEFKNLVNEQLDQIGQSLDKLWSELEKNNPSAFLNSYMNGLISDPDILKTYLENVIFSLAENRATKFKMIEKIKNLLFSQLQHLQSLYQQLKKEIVTQQFQLPKFIEKIEPEIQINKKKWISIVNGIDFHPFENSFVASTNMGGDMVVFDLTNNKELHRVSMNNYSGDFNDVDNYLWSPSGNELLVATHDPPCILIYDKNCKLIKSIKNTNSSCCGWGALWINSTVIAIGYDNCLIKIFNTEKLTEITTITMKGKIIWGMENLDEHRFFAGDNDGNLAEIGWEEDKILWSASIHKKNFAISLIRLSKNKSIVITGSYDTYIKCISVEKKHTLWKFKMNSYVHGIAFCSGESSILALSHKNQLILIDVKFGNKLIEFNSLSQYCCSLRLNKRTEEILVGDFQGFITRLKLIFQGGFCRSVNKNYLTII